MNQYTVSDFQIGCVLIKFERVCLGFGNNPCSTNRAKVAQAKVQPAIIQQIGDILIRMPSLALDQTRELPEILQLGPLGRAGTVAEQIRGIPAPVSSPGRTALANFLVESFKARRNVSGISAERVLVGNQFVSR